VAQEDSGQAQPQGSARPAPVATSEARLIALIVISASLAIMAVLGLVAISTSKDPTENAYKVLTIILPMIGAWVGTVLAFYFGKENYSAAAASTHDLVRQLSSDEKLKQIPVDSVMIAIKDATTLVLAPPKTEATVKLKADLIDGCLVPKSRNRLPILSGAGMILYVVHRSLIDGFLVQRVAAGQPLADLTLADMLKQPDIAGSIRDAFGTVKPKTTLADVKAQMDGIPNCADVFVTEDGSRNTKVLGWITNVMVAERARV
jgi:hypothetical protein